MKKLFISLLFACLAMPSAIQAQELSKSAEKAIKKEVSTKMKELKKGKWEVFDTSHSMERALWKHYEKLEKGEDKVFDMIGYATAKSKNLASTAALASACNRYATQASTRVIGKLISELENNGTNNNEDLEKFRATFLSEVEKDIRGDLHLSFGVIRKDETNGSYEVQVYYIVDQEAASRSRLRALEIAEKETQFSENIKKIVKETAEESFVPSNE